MSLPLFSLKFHADAESDAARASVGRGISRPAPPPGPTRRHADAPTRRRADAPTRRAGLTSDHAEGTGEHQGKGREGKGGKGIDTYDRYVYLHGTNHEENLGVPASSGCLQVSNEDAIELHDRIPVGSHLFVKL